MISNYAKGFQVGYNKGIFESREIINRLESALKDYKRLLDIKHNTIRIIQGNNLVQLEEINDTPQGLFIKLKNEKTRR
jgi:hypothetical protein